MSYRIAVPQPCDEDWNEMTPKGCGRFCAACEKTVVDFTAFSDEDFIAYFRKNGINTCGRFSPHQFALDIPWLDTGQLQPEPNRWSKTLTYAALSLLPVVLPAVAPAQQRETTQHPVTRPGIITGTVLDERGEAVPAVSVTIKGTTYRTLTDVDGHFELQVQNTPNVLEFTAIGMATCVKEVKDITQPVAVTLSAELVEIRVADPYTKHPSQVGLVNFDQKKISGIPVTDVTKALEGNAPGVPVYATMGAPPSTPSIMLNNNNLAKPLIVLNGKHYTGNITDIDPHTVKKMKILMDKNALKKYGTKGVNGVIIIDTKSITLWERLTRYFRRK